MKSSSTRRTTIGDEPTYHRHGALWRIWEHRVPTSGKPLETDKMSRERGGDICLTLDWRHWIVFPAQQERRTLHLGKRRKQVEGVAFSARAGEPPRDFRMADGALQHCWITWRASVKGKGETDPGVKRDSICMPIEKSATRQGADLGSTEALKQRHSPLPVCVAGSLGADQHEFGGMGRMARGIR